MDGKGARLSLANLPILVFLCDNDDAEPADGGTAIHDRRCIGSAPSDFCRTRAGPTCGKSFRIGCNGSRIPVVPTGLRNGRRLDARSTHVCYANALDDRDEAQRLRGDPLDRRCVRRWQEP